MAKATRTKKKSRGTRKPRPYGKARIAKTPLSLPLDGGLTDQQLKLEIVRHLALHENSAGGIVETARKVFEFIKERGPIDGGTLTMADLDSKSLAPTVKKNEVPKEPNVAAITQMTAFSEDEPLNGEIKLEAPKKHFSDANILM